MDSLKFDHQQTHIYTNEELYYKQVETLKLFLERNAISREQYNKSLRDLTDKMGMNKP